MKTFLRIGDDSIFDATPYTSKRAAIAAFRCVAEELARYGQPIEASLHYAPSLAEITEDADYVLSLGPRGGVAVGQT